jgi:uncharacterized OB-fold protein
MREEKILRKICKNCGLMQHTSHIRCLNCKHRDFNLIEAEEKCKLVSYTILKAPPMEFAHQESYILGLVEFENGIKAMGQISEEKKLVTGMLLKPVF